MMMPVEKTPADGKAIYDSWCMPCHQQDGSGVPGLNPALFNSDAVSGDKQILIKWVLKGTTEKKAINDTWYSNNMPPQDFLKDEEIAAVLTYIRSSFGNKASKINAKEVAVVRNGLQ